MILLASVIVILSFLLWKYGRRYLAYRALFNKLPGEESFSYLYGNLHKYPGPNEEGMMYDYELSRKFKYLRRIWAGPLIPVVILYHPDSIRPVLKSSVPKPRGTYFSTAYDMGLRWLGEGLLIANGPRWARSRRLLTPAFHFDILKSYIEVYNQCSNVLLERIRKLSESSEPFDVFQPVSMCALDVILRCAFSYQFDCQTKGENEYTSALTELLMLWTDRSLTPLYFFEFIYGLTRAGKRFYHLCDVVHAISEDIIDKRRKQLENQDEKIKLESKKIKDFLDMLLTAVDDDGVGLSPLEIRNEVDTFLFEGHDTTTSGTAWTLYRLAQHPEYQERIYEEVVGVLGDKTELTWDDLQHLEFTTMCIKEALRLDTAVPFIERKLEEEMKIGDHILPKGTLIGIQIWILHHNPHIWEQPHDYLPERFHPNLQQHMDPFQFLPFSAGSRNCIGQNFAMNEMKITIANVIRNFKLTSDPSKPARRFQGPTQKTESGAFLFAVPREKL